jgi:hypothetical protein
MPVTEPRIFAADRTFRKLRDAGILSEARSVDGLVLEVICRNWTIRIRGSIAVEGDRREWHEADVDWDEAQASETSPLLDALERVETHLRGLAARERKVKAKLAAKSRQAATASQAPAGGRPGSVTQAHPGRTLRQP